MSRQITARESRIAFNLSSSDDLKDLVSGQIPKIPRGNAYTLSGALFAADPRVADNLIDDLSTIASVTMVCRNDGASGTFLFEKVVPFSDFNAGMTFDQWAARTAQQFSVVLSGTETNQALPAGKLSLPIYIAFQVDLVGADPVFMGSFSTTIFEEGIGTAGTPTPGDPTYSTTAEGDARWAQISPVTSADLVNGPGKYFVDANYEYRWSPATSSVYRIQILTA